MAITGQEPGPWKVELRVCRGRLGIVSISGGFAYPDLYAPALAAVHALHNPSDKRVDIAAIRDVATRGGRWVDLIETPRAGARTYPIVLGRTRARRICTYLAVSAAILASRWGKVAPDQCQATVNRPTFRPSSPLSPGSGIAGRVWRVS